MTRRHFPWLSLSALLLCAFVLAGASTARGQAAGTSTGGSIWGKVTDRTGATLPGVTVTVTARALMGAQETVTNAQGVYRFPSLPPGTFTLSFRMPGFNTLTREGIRLTLAFTATIDVQMELQSVIEKVEVVGRSPVVDVVNTREQTSFDKELLQSAPLARDMWAVLGASPSIAMARIDVGASTAGTQTDYRGYGMLLQNRPVVEGVLAIDTQGGTSYFDYGSFDEISVGAAGQSAEMANPGTQTVFISKSGGNAFHGDVYIDNQSSGLQWKNIDATQIALGVVPGTNRIQQYNDLNVDAGGYLVKDKVWWFGSYRYRRNVVQLVNFPVSDYPTIMPFYTGKGTIMLPHQNRLVVYWSEDIKKQPYRQTSLVAGGNAIFLDPNATWNCWDPGWLGKIEWNKVFSNNLFVEARIGHWADDWYQSSYSKTAPHYEDLITGLVRGGQYDWYRYYSRPQATGAVTYFKDGWAGSHTFKLGWEIMKDSGVEEWRSSYPGGAAQILRSGVPAEVYLLYAPIHRENYQWWDGIYFTDTWTHNRVTINVGARYDHYKNFYPDQYRPANQWAPAMSVTGVSDLLTWNVIGPRIGVAFDVSGDSRNVVKASYGRYYQNMSRNIPMIVNPNDAPQWRRYAWNDLNGDLVYEPGEEGQLLATRGGVAAGGLGPDLKAPYTDEVAVFFEREVARNFGLRTGFVMKRNTRLTQTVNSLYPYSAFNIPVDVVDRGPDNIVGTADDGVLHLFNLQPNLIGQVKNLVISPSNWVTNYKTWEFVANRRLSGRWSMIGSVAVTWRNDWNAYPTNPNMPPQSAEIPVWMARLGATVDAGWGFHLSPLVRYQQGDPWARVASVSLNYGSQSVLAEPMGTRRLDDSLVFDVRVERQFRLPRQTKLGLFLDLFNITNQNVAFAINATTGSSFMRPTAIMAPRVVRIGAKVSF
jgi:hypothetical protein